MKLWYQGGPEEDTLIKDNFGPLVDSALENKLGPEWEETPKAALAKIIILDQFTRNLYRGTPKAFAGDEQAVRIRIIETTRILCPVL
mmetsp:Transcript_27737/g.60620  ORF Transcript_27737/g.60620 Transcript_27737/m.60620 type:complete len:87 (-) Transcript_27737:2722-2982(-)